MILLALLALCCAAFVAWPLLRVAPDALAAEPELFGALEERDRALAALRELEFDDHLLFGEQRVDLVAADDGVHLR